MMSKRFGEGLQGKKKQPTWENVSSLHDQLQKLGRQNGTDLVHGERRLTAAQVATLDEICIMFNKKKCPVLAMKS
jgi:hypothetical protein